MYAVEFAHRPGRDLINVAKTRPNIVPIIEDARHPLKYRMLVGMVDTIFADVAQPDQARIVGINAKYFLKTGGHCVIFDQGELHRFDGVGGSRVCRGGAEAERGALQAAGAVDAGAVRARPCCCDGRVQT